MSKKKMSRDASGRREGKGGGIQGSHIGEGKQEALTCTPHIVGAPCRHCSEEPGAGCRCSYSHTVYATPQSAPLRSRGLGTSADGALGGSG